LVAVSTPFPATNRKLLFWNTTVEEVRLKVKSPKPTIVQSGVIGVEGLKTQGCEKETAWPLGIMVNEPELESTWGDSQDWIPAATPRFVVVMPSES
jgi:hypothetical protein